MTSILGIGLEGLTKIASGAHDHDDEKYIVFKREDLLTLMGELALPNAHTLEWTGDTDCSVVAQHVLERLKAESLEDAVVIRRKDVFAPAGLYAYANGIMTALDIARETVGDLMSEDEVARLTAIADYFARQADLAAHYHSRKVPD